MEPPRIRDYYADLCIQQSATAQDIRRAHRVLAIRLHPDKQPPGAKVDTEKFRIIQEAYEYLRDASRRNRYDMYYEDVKEKWRAYREFKNEECERERQQQAEKEERQRQADEAQRARRKEEARKAAEEMAERLGRDAKKEEMEQRAREYWTKLREREDAQRRTPRTDSVDRKNRPESSSINRSALPKSSSIEREKPKPREKAWMPRRERRSKWKRQPRSG
ncbi:hypothetical protein COL5a_001920 [Colletotrichum fioriniae]|nr:uncharacterized protein COL516b_001310 [Colletotrichum fioriniae]KAJ0312236.1 hypothetical protein COL516b_001310 [Colletotrichum fioriniae]KAJ0332214.1 hypothetical protein COL5a_001920 [Colletotrichum fioriniae]